MRLKPLEFTWQRGLLSKDARGCIITKSVVEIKGVPWVRRAHFNRKQTDLKGGLMVQLLKGKSGQNLQVLCDEVTT